MPKRPVCTGADIGDTIEINVLKPDKSQKIWIRWDHLNWLLSYAADEHSLGGVQRVPDPAVAERQVEWVFDKKIFVATAPTNGTTRIYKLSPDDLDQPKWRLLKQKGQMPDKSGYVSKQSYKTKKEATRRFLALWCDAVIAGTAEEFDKLLENSAVADESSEDSGPSGAASSSLLSPRGIASGCTKRELEGDDSVSEHSPGSCEDSAVAEPDAKRQRLPDAAVGLKKRWADDGEM